MTTLPSYRIQFIRSRHLPGCYNRYYHTKAGLLKRLVSLFQDPLVRKIEVTKGDRSRLQPFYSAFATIRIQSKATVEGQFRWYIPSWGWGSWKALSRLLEVDEDFWDRYRLEDEGGL